MEKYPESKKCVFRNEETEGDRDLTLNIDLNHLVYELPRKVGVGFQE